MNKKAAAFAVSMVKFPRQPGSYPLHFLQKSAPYKTKPEPGKEATMESKPKAHEIQSFPRAGMLLIMGAASFMTPFMGSALNVALPAISNDLGLNAIMLSWVQTSYILATAVFLVPFGRLADMYGRRLFFLAGLALFTLASLALGFSSSALFLLVMRGIQGVGGAMTFATAMPILISLFPAEERGRVIGITTACVYAGLSFGPFCGGFLTEHLGWRWVFFFCVPISLFCLVFGARWIHQEQKTAAREGFDLRGSLLYGISLLALVVGFSSLPGMRGWLLMGAAAASFFWFCRWELTVKGPLLDLQLFRANAVFAFSNLAALINYAATYAVGFLLSLYLQYVRGLSPREAGMILVAQPIIMALFSPFAGRISDKIEPRILASSGMALTAISLVGFNFMDETTPIAYLVGGLLLLGLSFALFSSPNTNAVMSSVERKFFSVASGTLGTMRMTGQMLSMGIATLIFAIYFGDAKLSSQDHTMVNAAIGLNFNICAALCVMGVFASLARGRMRAGVTVAGGVSISKK